jgi:hypothetical protein
MMYVKMIQIFLLCTSFYGSSFCSQAKPAQTKPIIKDSVAIPALKKAFSNMKNLQNKIQKNRAKNDNNSWAQDKKELKEIFAEIDQIIIGLSDQACKELHEKIRLFNLEKQNFIAYEAHYDAAIAAQTLVKVTERQAPQPYVNVAVKMRAILGMPVEAATDSASAAADHVCNHGGAQLPENVRHALLNATAAAAEEVDHCKQRKEVLAKQDEDCLTPALRAVSYGNAALFEALTQLEHQQHDDLQEKIYAQDRNTQVIGCLLAYDYAPCVPADKPARSYFVHSPHYRSFSCYPFLLPKTEFGAFHAKYKDHKMIMGIPAYRLTSALEARAQSCPNVFAVDNCAVRERINKTQQEYQQRLPLFLTRDVGAHITVAPLRKLVAAYLLNDFPIEGQAAIAPVIPKQKPQIAQK